MSKPVTQTPGLPDEIEGVMEAPVVYFENSPAFGVGPGIGKIVLEVGLIEPGAAGEAPKARRRVVAHLRGPLAAFAALRQAINEMEAMITPKQGEKPN